MGEMCLDVLILNFIFLAGMESVQLRRMWLQSCCLVATTTEIRDQGKDPDTHKLNESCDLRKSFLHFCFYLPTDTKTPTCGDSTISLPPHRAFPLGVSQNAPRGADMCLSLLIPEPKPN